MIKTLFLTVVVLLFTGNVFASSVSIESSGFLSGYKFYIVTKTINQVTTFFSNKGLLINNVRLIVVDDYIKYERVLREMDFSKQKIKQLSNDSSGVAFDNTVIVVYDRECSPSKISKSIAHELTHQYQFAQHGDRATDNMWMLEGAAEYVGHYFQHGSFPKKNKDQGIPKEEITKYQQWHSAIQKYGANRVYKQALFYYTEYLKTTGKDFTI